LEVSGHITKGELEAAGQKLLGIIPRATVCSRVILLALEQQSTSTTTTNNNNGSKGTANLRVEAFLTDFAPKLSQCDIMIGQGIRGEMGSITFAQIQVLESLKDSLNDYNEILKGLDTWS
jgi:hypothetical protein